MLQVLAPLVSLAHSLSPFAERRVSSSPNRPLQSGDRLLTAREPGELLFEALPEGLCMKALTVRASSDAAC